MTTSPSRRALRFLDEITTQILPEDPTPSLDEIAARPDVAHLGTPGPAPQAPHLPERLRVIVAGTDAALSAVLTRLMRADHLWAEVGFVPSSSDPTAARNWGLPTSGEAALELAMTGTVRPVPLIRTDAGVAVAGSATITDWETPEITGEIIVDDDVLVRHEGAGGVVGARLVPMLDAPGIVAGRTVLPPAGWRERITTWPVLRRFSRGQAQTPKRGPGHPVHRPCRTGRRPGPGCHRRRGTSPARPGTGHLLPPSARSAGRAPLSIRCPASDGDGGRHRATPGDAGPREMTARTLV
ncbi:hypothetical protein QP028_09330 [Corynebacterium suedekumii]|nr:hypothetical protein QP028_09330 [Corynebacterium suedekumii]